MNRLGLIVFFAVVLAIALTATAPLRLALAFAPLEAAGFSAQNVRGSVWNGVAERARLGGLELGDLAVRLDPLAAATGRLKARLAAAGRISGSGAFVFGQTWGVEGFTGALPFEQLGLDLPLTGRLAFAGLDAVIGPEGCATASGVVSTDALRVSASTLQWQGPELRGEARCAADGAVEAPLTGTDGASTVTAVLRLYADGRFTLETRVNASDPTMAAALQPAGFAPGPEGYTRFDEGRLRDVASR